MDDIKKLAKQVAGYVKGDKTKSYDTSATVTKVTDDAIYVHIPGGVSETPVKKTIDAKAGDTVQVHVGNGTAWLVGNQTAPPTDDAEALVAKAVAKVADQNATKAKTTADEAQATANAVSGIANTALTQAQAAKQIADDTEQHFWFTETGTDTGAHITEVTQDEWEDPSSPNYHSGGNLLGRSNGVAVREGMKELATMSQDGFDAISYDDNSNAVPIAHLGYGPGVDSQGTTAKAPYYTIGTRRTGTIGQYSLVNGTDNIAGGWCSHAEGHSCEANTYGAHAEGFDTIAGYPYQHVMGKYNDNKSADVLEIGNGTGPASSQRSNAFEVTNTGDITAPGKATLGAINGDSLFAYTSISVTTSSIAANASGEATSSASTLSGYYPLAITDVSISTGVASLRRFYFSTQQTGRAVVKIGVQNDGTSAKTISATAKILWVKTSV